MEGDAAGGWIRGTRISHPPPGQWNSVRQKPAFFGTGTVAKLSESDRASAVIVPSHAAWSAPIQPPTRGHIYGGPVVTRLRA